MLQMKEPCIMLDGVVCNSEYSEGRLMCPRAIHSYWREIWLDRFEASAPANVPSADLTSKSNDSREAQPLTEEQMIGPVK